MVDANKTKELSKKMLFMLDENSNSNMGLNARDYVMKNHNIENNAKIIHDIYKNCIYE